MPRFSLNVLAVLALLAALLGCLAFARQDDTTDAADDEATATVYFLEIVTPDADATCDALTEIHGVAFSEPVAEFGNARTAQLSTGGLISVRGPLRPDEGPVVRPYLLVDDIEAAVKAAEAAGAKVAIPPMKLGDQGTFAIYILGGIEHGLWQTP